MIAPVSLLAFYGTSALNGLLLSATKVYRAAQCRSAAVLVPAMLGIALVLQRVHTANGARVTAAPGQGP